MVSGLHFFSGRFGFGCLIFLLDVWADKRDPSLCENVALMKTEHFRAQDLPMSL